LLRRDARNDARCWRGLQRWRRRRRTLFFDAKPQRGRHHTSGLGCDRCCRRCYHRRGRCRRQHRRGRLGLGRRLLNGRLRRCSSHLSGRRGFSNWLRPRLLDLQLTPRADFVPLCRLRRLRCRCGRWGRCDFCHRRRRLGRLRFWNELGFCDRCGRRRLRGFHQARRRQHGCRRFRRLRSLLGSGRALAAWFTLYGRRFGEDVARRQRDVPLLREPVDELACYDLFDGARSALHFDPVIALEQRGHLLARRVEQFRDLINPNS